MGKNIQYNNSVTTYDLSILGKTYQNVKLPLPGKHMVLNSLALFAVCNELGINIEEAIKSLETFPGVSRRSEILNSGEPVLVIDDYAHHPTEIKSTLTALKTSCFNSNSEGKLIALFEPHRYSRTKDLLNDFSEAFIAADEVVVGDIYPAGEKPIEGINSQLLVDKINHDKVTHKKDLNEEIPNLLRTLKDGDVVVTLGAGEITHVARKLSEELKQVKN